MCQFPLSVKRTRHTSVRLHHDLKQQLGWRQLTPFFNGIYLAFVLFMIMIPRMTSSYALSPSGRRDLLLNRTCLGVKC